LKCLVFVKFLPGGAIAPQEFFARINARWSCLNDSHEVGPENSQVQGTSRSPSARSAICIAEYDSIEQLALDLSIMPGAGISNVEVLPISDAMAHNYSRKEYQIETPG
jgi:hypothetical protein